MRTAFALVVVADTRVAGVAFRILIRYSLHEVAAIVVTPRRETPLFATTAIVRTPEFALRISLRKLLPGAIGLRFAGQASCTL